jgi:tetratricopeptide (TPR) repeat protein
VSRNLLRITIALSLAGAAGGARVAHAQPANTDKAKAKTAKQYVDAALAAQDAKDYDTAIELYQKAYALVPHPVLLFDIAQAHRLAGRVDNAITFYKRYLDADPNGPQASTAHDILAEIAAKRAAEAKQKEDERNAEEARKADEARKAQAARDAEAKRKADEALAKQQAVNAAKPEQPDTGEPPAAAHPGRTQRIGGIVLGGAGVVASGLAIYFGLHARSISDDLSQPGAMYDPSRVHDGESAESTAIGLGIAGAALIVGGGVVYMLGYRSQHAAQEHVSVRLRPGFAGLAFTGALP